LLAHACLGRVGVNAAVLTISGAGETREVSKVRNCSLYDFFFFFVRLGLVCAWGLGLSSCPCGVLLQARSVRTSWGPEQATGVLISYLDRDLNSNLFLYLNSDVDPTR
jgi:hypothetical protein